MTNASKMMEAIDGLLTGSYSRGVRSGAGACDLRWGLGIGVAR